MSGLLDFDIDIDHEFTRGLRDYLAAVTSALGIGLESCTVDLDVPASAYVALDRFPGRDLALLWNERHGWAVAVETHRGGDLVVLSYLGGSEVVPRPHRVAEFLAAFLAEDHSFGQPGPPNSREPGDHRALVELLAQASFPGIDR